MTDAQIAYLEYFVKYFGVSKDQDTENKEAPKTDVKGCWY